MTRADKWLDPATPIAEVEDYLRGQGADVDALRAEGAALVKRFRLLAQFDDGCEPDVLGYFDDPQEAREYANRHKVMMTPFTREYVDFKVEEVAVDGDETKSKSDGSNGEIL